MNPFSLLVKAFWAVLMMTSLSVWGWWGLLYALSLSIVTAVLGIVLDVELEEGESR